MIILHMIILAAMLARPFGDDNTGYTKTKPEFKLVELQKDDVKNTYFDQESSYLGSDKNFHYLLGITTYHVHTISKNDFDDKDMVALFNEKQAGIACQR